MTEKRRGWEERLLGSRNARFLDKNRAEFIQRVTMVMPLADELLSLGMLHEETYSKIKAANTSQEKMRELFTALHCGGDRVKSAFYRVLERLEPHLLQDLGKRIEELQSLIVKYKQSTSSQYAYVTEYNSLPGEHVLLASRYTELLIIQTHREQSEREEEICTKGERFFSARDSEKYSNITVDQFFCPDDHGLIPKAVVLQGNSGNGKSFTAQKIMLEWASGTVYTDHFDFIFHLKCKEINQISGEKSLVELLRYSQSLTPAQISQILQHSPERVLFLIDGFDELKLSQDNMSNLSPPLDVQTPASAESTLKALMSGHLLPESFLLVTTRSTATDTLSKLLKKQPQRFTEIMGFSERGVEEYFQRFFKDDQLLRTQAYEHVKANETLFTACFIPVICWIICTVFRQRHKGGIETTSSLETTTSIYVDYVSTMLDHHCQGLSQSVPSLLRSLGQLAERGMMEQQVLFNKKCVTNIVSDPTSNPFLCKFLCKKKIRQETMFSFMHLSFQEFFTALYYRLSLSETTWLKFLSPEFIEEDSRKLDLLPVIQFLCGLSNKEVSSSVMEAHCLSVSPNIREQLEEWILKFIEDRDIIMQDTSLFILHCLYELHEEDFVRKAMESWEEIDLSRNPLKRTDCWVLLYCLKCCPHIKSLSLTHCSITVEKLKILQPALRQCKELELGVENLSDDDVGVLVSALGEGKDLRGLSLDYSALSDQSVQQVLNALSKQTAVGYCSITVRTVTTYTAFMLREFLLNQNGKGDIRSPETDEQLDALLFFLCSVSGLRKVHLKVRKLTRSWSTMIFSLMPTCSSLQHISSPEFDEQVEALLNFLHTVPGLKKVELKLNILTESWAARILSFIQTHPSLRPVSLTMAKSLACPFPITGTPHGRGGWCHKVKEEFDEQTNALLSVVDSIPGLKRVKLNVIRLTESWASRIISLIQSCTSLQDISFKAGSELDGFLLEEGIRLLQHSQKRPDCTLTVEGMRCSKDTDQCTEDERWSPKDCNRIVKLQFHGESLTVLD
ncbi:NACHT, LRR and PYD domains-containing protein 3-like [Chanos chanos]|uniref:NACHT, LRR and PYD domains-containing protein 3-like n=1 Tax=Chanos chanos TaxID=29144 RepID=A0A6J2VAJ1_CHACN|nr:NACHT, LRR and PYD domains-containing protein 3-like [Chanos chanos]